MNTELPGSHEEIVPGTKATEAELRGLINDEPDTAESAAKTTEKGNAFLDERTSTAAVMLHNLIHLPETTKDSDGRKDLVVNALLKTGGVVLGALAVKLGIDAEQVPVAAELVIGGSSIASLMTSILQGMLATEKTRRFRASFESGEGVS